MKMKESTSLVICLLVLYQTALSSAFTTLHNTRDKIAKLEFTKLHALESTSICVVGGGVSGLTAALTASKHSKTNNIVLLESSATLGGRVQSDKVEQGFILDRGFAVFIEDYPLSKELLDYDSLKLGKFLPGALVKIKGSDKLARVADPLRVPGDLLTALLAPVGSLIDKIAVLPLIFHVRTKTIDELFNEPETDTLTALKERWKFSDDMIDKFFKPFLEGIYLAPLNEQSSRMFSFVFKMFSEGAAALPEGGMGSVADQLASKAVKSGVDIRNGESVSSISRDDEGFILKSENGEPIIKAKSIIIATDGPIAKKILSTLDGFESLQMEEEQTQRSVGCMYYSFEGNPPVDDPILILNGIGSERGNELNPVNNACFPSVVSASYSPKGSNLCSVTILKPAMDAYAGREKDLDIAVRNQLGTWFPQYKDDILQKWTHLRTFDVRKAQPAQLFGPEPANVHRGRYPNTYRGKNLPNGLFVCGDHVATATLNGALESGVNAGKEAAAYIKL